MNNIEILEMQLKKIKNFCKDNDNINYYPEELPYYMFWNGKQAEIVENLIKENKELKEAFNNCFNECTSLRKNFHNQLEINKNSIPKTKVREKIKHIKNLNEKLYYEANVIWILEELLQEE